MVKDGDQLDWSCGKLSIKRSQDGEEYPTYNEGGEANRVGHNFRRNCLLKHFAEGKMEGYKWQKDEVEDVSNYWTILRKLEDTLNWNRAH